MPVTTPSTQTSMDLSAILRLEDCPSVRPLYEKRLALQARLQALEEEITTARRALYEVGHASIPLPLRSEREARQRLTDLTEEEERIRYELGTLNEELEVAKRQAQTELRPGVDAAALQVLLEAEAAMEALMTAQGKLQVLERRVRGLTMSAPLWVANDLYLPYRLKRTRETIATLRARQG
jgi:hypothetical protein